MNTDRESLLDVLEETKGLLMLQENDFAWSGWDSREVALADIDSHIERVKKSDRTKRLELQVLFAPTGPIQEVSVSSGWGDEFLKLAARFDAAEKADPVGTDNSGAAPLRV